jgi:hypothetical protein
MNIRINILALAFSIGLACPLLAQAPQSSDGLSMAEQNAVGKKKDPNDRAKEYMKIANQKALDARKAADRGDANGLDESLRGHQAAMRGAMRTIHEGQSSGEDMSRAWEAVNRGTSKHTEVLTDVLSRVPDQAKPGIQKALDSSQRGHDTALQSLEKARQERTARGETGFPRREGMSDRRRGGPPDIREDQRGTGRPAGIGAGRPAGGPSSGAGRGRGR